MGVYYRSKDNFLKSDQCENKNYCYILVISFYFWCVGGSDIFYILLLIDN